MKPGYKQTEVGEIPEDWSECSVREAAAARKNAIVGGPFGSDLVSADYVDVGIPVIRGQNLTKRYVSEPFVFISQTKANDLSANMARAGDLVFTQRGTLGQVAIVPSSAYAQYLISQSQMKVTIDGERYDPEFILHYFLSSFGQKQILDSAIQTGVPHTNLGILRKYRFPAPPIVEQRALASTLTDMDAAVSGLERLVAKKHGLKQATIQQLLTGQTRLPGFSDAWPVKRLGDYVRFLRNGTLSRAQLTTDDPVQYLHYGDIHGSSGVFLSPSTANMPTVPNGLVSRIDRLGDGDLVFVDASEDLEGVGKSVEIQMKAGREVVSGLHTIAARFDKDVLVDGFKAYLQFIPVFSAHLKKHAAGTKVLATSRSHIASAELELPGPTEQKAIALVFRDMDFELSALKEQLEKTRLIRRAMMQELLTGRTRLPFQ